MSKRIITIAGLTIGLFLVGLITGANAQADKCKDPGPFPKAEEFMAVDKAPELFSEAAPVYPPDEKAKGVEGLVWVKALVDKCGKVQEAVVSESSGVKALDESALSAARQNEFIPAESGGGPVACWVTYKVEFKVPKGGPVAPESTTVRKEHEAQQQTVVPAEPVPSPDDSVLVDVMPDMLSAAKPEYPKLCKVAGVTGIVWVKALVDRTGAVREAAVAKSSQSTALDESAVKAAYNCRFKPAVSDGRPVACWVTYKVEFKLND